MVYVPGFSEFLHSIAPLTRCGSSGDFINDSFWAGFALAFFIIGTFVSFVLLLVGAFLIYQQANPGSAEPEVLNPAPNAVTEKISE